MARTARMTLLSILCLVAAGSARAADTEQREFSILVDGKEAGLSRLTITVQDDGTTVVAGTAQIRFTKLVFNYTLTIESMEWWKEGKLIGVKSTATENSKKTEVVAAMEGNQLRLKVNGKDSAVKPEVWTSSFWKLADPRYHNKPLPILETDSGKEYQGQLQYVGAEQLNLVNQLQNCYHFRVAGGSSPVDVWFDRYHRLVRQEFVDSGHKTIVQLINIKR